jgi:hypothetical protein
MTPAVDRQIERQFFRCPFLFACTLVVLSAACLFAGAYSDALSGLPLSQALVIDVEMVDAWEGDTLSTSLDVATTGHTRWFARFLAFPAPGARHLGNVRSINLPISASRAPPLAL